MQIPGADQKGRDSSNFVAAEDAGSWPTTPSALLERAVGVEWYDSTEPTSTARRSPSVDCDARAPASEAAPRPATRPSARSSATASPAALLWLASRAISYMDESGFPEAVEPWFRDEWAQDF